MQHDVDVAVIGVPFDTATSFRSGARFGPEAIRSASMLLRPYHPVHAIDVLGALSAVDGGDLEITPGNARSSAEQIAARLQPLLEAGIVPVVLGGDHSVVLGELRAQAAVHGPVGLVLLDAHADTWDQYYGEKYFHGTPFRYFHGTPFRRAVEEGLLAPERSLLAGMRGPLYSAADLDQPREMGFEVIDGEELQHISAADYSRRARARIGDGPTFMSFDIDVLDPSIAPGTGTPEIGGLRAHQALSLIRALAGIVSTGFDVVEVSPPYDTPAQVTALHAAAVAYEMLALLALTRQ